MIDVLFLTHQDYANTGWKFFKAAQSIGLKCLALKGVIHPFYYPEQTVVHPKISTAVKHPQLPIFKIQNSLSISAMAKAANVLHFTSSTCFDIDGIDLGEKNVVVQHSGREYRIAHKHINNIYNNFANATIIQMPDLLELGAINETLIYFPVDTEQIRPDYSRHRAEVVFGHLPSQPQWKGSREILTLAKKMSEECRNFVWASPFLYNELESGRVWYENLDDLKALDVLIDTCADTAYGHPYGEWGNTAFEAAAMGKIVITNSLNIEKYNKNYGECELIIANTINEVERAIKNILTWNDVEIYNKKRKTRKWVKANHSIQATGDRLWKEVYRTMF